MVLLNLAGELAVPQRGIRLCFTYLMVFYEVW